MIHGKDLILYFQGDGITGDTGKMYPVACDQSCTMEIMADMIESTGNVDNIFKYFLPTTLSTKISGNGLIDFTKVFGVPDLQTIMLQRRQLLMRFIYQKSDAERIIYTGNGYLSDLSITGAVNNAGAFSYQITISGTLVIDTTMVTDDSNSKTTTDVTDIYKIQFIGTAGQTSYQDNNLITGTILEFVIEGDVIYFDGHPDDAITFDPVGGTLTWGAALNVGDRCIILYKK